MKNLFSDAKAVAALLIMAAWFVLVLTGQAATAPFVDALRDLLLGLGFAHGVTRFQGVRQEGGQ